MRPRVFSNQCSVSSMICRDPGRRRRETDPSPSLGLLVHGPDSVVLYPRGEAVVMRLQILRLAGFLWFVVFCNNDAWPPDGAIQSQEHLIIHAFRIDCKDAEVLPNPLCFED